MVSAKVMYMSPESMTSNETPQIPWSEIQERLGTIAPVEGGNTDAQRGIATLPSGSEIFVKIGVNEHTKGWATKEIRSYEFLKKHKYSFNE